MPFGHFLCHFDMVYWLLGSEADFLWSYMANGHNILFGTFNTYVWHFDISYLIWTWFTDFWIVKRTSYDHIWLMDITSWFGTFNTYVWHLDISYDFWPWFTDVWLPMVVYCKWTKHRPYNSKVCSYRCYICIINTQKNIYLKNGPESTFLGVVFFKTF